MSIFYYIASDFILPEVEYFNLQENSTDNQISDIQQDINKKRDSFESNNYLIIRYTEPNGITEYINTKKKYFYEVVISGLELIFYTSILAGYLKQNAINKDLELWIIWAGNYTDIYTKSRPVDLQCLNETKFTELFKEAQSYVCKADLKYEKFQVFKDYYTYTPYYEDVTKCYCFYIQG